MAVASLFKHKVRFELRGHDRDWSEFFIPSKGYHYSSNWIENGESVGIRRARDLFIDKLKPLFLHIISTMYHEAEMEISGINITVRVFELINYYDIVRYKFTSAPNDAITNYSISWVCPFPERLIRNGFYIYIGSYVYYEVEENKPLASPVETYRQDCCVVCLEAKPNILYLDCMHIAICDLCDRMKSKTSSQSTCDVCRAKISKRLKL